MLRISIKRGIGERTRRVLESSETIDGLTKMLRSAPEIKFLHIQQRET